MRRKISLSSLIFMALCCDLGMISKKLISPAANIITEALHIPGGIGASFSIMFIVVGASVCNIPGSASLMGVVQSFIALVIGTTGSMGALAPIGYVVPGIVIDVFFLLCKRTKLSVGEKTIIANAIAGASAAVCANAITFRLFGPPLWLYIAVAFTSGIIFGVLGASLVKRLSPIVNRGYAKRQETK